MWLRIAENTSKDAIGDGFVRLVEAKASTIDTILKDMISETKILANNDEIKQAIVAANLGFRGEDNMMKVDEEWITAKKSNVVAQKIINNKLSQYLKRYKARDKNRYGEIFVTDINGAAVGMTKILSDYYQADETWWQEGFKGDTFLDDRGYDESVGALVVGVVVPIKEKDEIIGVLKINFKIEDVLAIISVDLGKTGDVFLARSQGDILVHSKGEGVLTESQRAVINNPVDKRADKIHVNTKVIYSYALVKTNIFTRVPSPGERKGISGEKWAPTTWYLFVEQDRQEAFVLVRSMRTMIMYLVMAVLFLVVLVSIIVARSITKPLAELTRGADKIGSGNLDYKVKVKSKDELGALAADFNHMTENLKRTLASRDELDKANQKLRLMDKTKDEFLSIVTHDLRSPLVPIDGFSDMMKDGLLGEMSEQQKHYAGRIKAQSLKMRAMIDHILDYTRIEFGTLRLSSEIFSLNEQISENMEEIKPAAEQKNQQISLDLPTEELAVNADRSMINRVIANLLGNAVKYTPENGKIAVALKRDQGLAVFSVQDSGQGIGKVQLERIFEKFYMIEEKTAREKGSLGLGLHICKSFIEANHGKVWAESEGEGKGAKFIFTLPLTQNTVDKGF